jgi:hypothetical protein
MHLSDSTTLIGVNAANVELVWEDILPMLIKTLNNSHREYDINEIKQQLIDREMQLWLAIHNYAILSFCITSIIINKSQKIACILFIGGTSLYSWVHFTKDIIEWAKQQGCTMLEGYGRKGWERMFKKYGVKTVQSIYALALQ